MPMASQHTGGVNKGERQMLLKVQRTPRGVPSEGEPLTRNLQLLTSIPKKKFPIFPADENHN